MRAKGTLLWISHLGVSAELGPGAWTPSGVQ